MPESALEVYLTLNTGAKIPAVGFGTVCPPERRSTYKDVLVAAIEAGYRHIDTAWKYETEPIIGEALKEVFARGIVKREDLFITTKVWPTLHANPLKSLNESLEALGVEYVDLFLQHWPLAFEEGDGGLPAVPVDENGNTKFVKDFDIFETYGKIVDIYKTTNKVKAIGVSNYTVALLEELQKRYDVVPAVNQLEIHPHLPQLDIVEYGKKNKIIIEAYSPLGSGGAPNLEIPLVKELAEKYSALPVDVLISYHVTQGRVVLPRSQNVERIKKGFKLVPLTEDDVDKLNKFGTENPKRYINIAFGKGIGFAHWS